MARLIPSLNSCLRKMQAGEKRFARRLESHLEDDYLCWFELPVGKRQRYSDFIILHPSRGLLLLEVKDWKLETIEKIDKISATIRIDNGLKTVSNPLQQVRQCAYQLVKRLESDPQLLNHEGRYKGNLVFPYGYGVVLSSISRKQFDTHSLGEVLPEHQVICKDEMTENIDVEIFQKSLWDMFNVQFPTPLTLPQIDRLRWHLFPEIRIGDGIQGELFNDDPEKPDMQLLLPDIAKVMDTQQELLARSMGDGHRVIHGVAGSGKTLILGYRCLYLASIMHKPILVLCYNVTLAARLRELMTERGIENKVSVYHFHDWCGEQLRTYHIQRPKSGKSYVTEMVEHVISAVEAGHIPTGQYGAVLIDEGHDLEADWLKLIVGMVDPETNSLLLLYDDAQSIYNKKNKLDFSLSSVGVQARGRTTVLKLNYRNTEEILSFAFRFAKCYLNVDDSGKNDENVPIIEPQSVGRHGPVPVVKIFNNFEREAHYISHIFFLIHQKYQIPWADMCVSYRNHWMGEALNKAFCKSNIPCQWLENSQAKREFKTSADKVKLMTMHSSKGLEFPVVAVSGIGYMQQDSNNLLTEAKLLYVAMTRSTERLLLTSHKNNQFIKDLIGDNIRREKTSVAKETIAN